LFDEFFMTNIHIDGLALPDAQHLQIAVYLAAINLFGFLVFAWDKYCAQNGNWRTKESTLLLLTALGGTIGVILAQQIFRHKTRKQPFRTHLFSIIVAQVTLLAIFSFPSGAHFFCPRLYA
jgi:uncharacterized membrane protein YsdA (DUF1294 family)